MSERENKRDSSDRRKPGGRQDKDRSESRKSDDGRRAGSRPYGERSEERSGRKPDSRKRTPYGDSERNKSEGRPAARKYDKSAERPDSRKRTTGKDEETNTTGRPDVRKYPTSKPFGYRGKRAVADVKYDGTIRLNKYISNSGICSRREADELIKSGLVEVNGKPVTEMGYKVQPQDIVKYAGEKLIPEKPVYFLLNKPKDYSAEMKATVDRRNGITLLRGIGNHSVLPVGKMDRSTSGLIVYTNDGDLTMKLCNPKLGVKKLFHVHLDKNLKREHLDKLLEGVELEDGFVKAEEVSYVGDKTDKKQIGIEMRSGKNKAVRRMLEALGYYVVKLDRVMYADLTKKDLPRGKWRELTAQEVINLKNLK